MTNPANAQITPPDTVVAPPKGGEVFRQLLAHRLFMAGAVILALLGLAALIGPWILDRDPSAFNIRARFAPPGAEHPFGTDNFGRDVLTRVLYGARTSFWIGLTVAGLTGLLGALVGLIAGYFRRLDSILMRLMDALLAFPAILLAIGIAAALGPQLTSVIVALTVTYLPLAARVVRASVLVIRDLEYVDAARLAGAGPTRMIFRHILPNCMAPLIVQMTFVFAFAILAEAILSFLGIGPPPPAPTWGNIIAEGRSFAVEAWWIMLFPGIAISIAVLGANLMGDGLRDVLDPRLKISA